MDANHLKYGITGFWMSGQVAPPTVSQRAVAGAAHTVAREIGWRVGAKRWATHSNFHEVRLVGADHHLSILFNISYPLVAFSEPLRDGEFQVAFRDHVQLARAVSELTEFRPLLTADLVSPLQEADLSELNEAERQQIAYWRPASVGELVFNFWD